MAPPTEISQIEEDIFVYAAGVDKSSSPEQRQQVLGIITDYIEAKAVNDNAIQDVMMALAQLSYKKKFSDNDLIEQAVLPMVYSISQPAVMIQMMESVAFHVHQSVENGRAIGSRRADRLIFKTLAYMFNLLSQVQHPDRDGVIPSVCAHECASELYSSLAAGAKAGIRHDMGIIDLIAPHVAAKVKRPQTPGYAERFQPRPWLM